MRFSSLSFKILLKFSSSNVYLKIPDFRIRGGSRAAATSKMECFVTIVNGWKSLTIITKHSILDVAAALDSPLRIVETNL